MKNCKSCGNQIASKGKVICPSCGMVNKKPFYQRTWVIIFVVLFLFMFTFMRNDSKVIKQPQGDIYTSRQTEESIEYIDITTDTLIETLDSNALKASDKYKGKYVKLSGLVTTIDSSGKYFTLSALNDTFTLTNIMCDIKDDKQLQKVMEFTDGQRVTVKGKITDVGEVLGYSLDLIEIE